MKTTNISTYTPAEVIINLKIKEKFTSTHTWIYYTVHYTRYIYSYFINKVLFLFYTYEYFICMYVNAPPHVYSACESRKGALVSGSGVTMQ